jgi:hypothetical protein
MFILGSGEEIWKDVVGYEGIYGVSDYERVRRTATGRMLKQRLDLRGCPRVNLYLRGKRTTRRVSTLVADAFLPAKCSTDEIVRHLNGNPADNRVCNLARGTQKENMADAIRHGTFHAKLTDDDVREIRRLYATGKFSQQELARLFGVSQRMIGFIVRRKSWKHTV